MRSRGGSGTNSAPLETTPRLQLRPQGASEGYIDGVWWPRSGALGDELPHLLAALTDRLGPARRVVYDRTSWFRVPRRLVIGDRAIQLDAYPFELGNTLYVYGVNGGMIVLRVIAAATDRHTATATLTDAGTRP